MIYQREMRSLAGGYGFDRIQRLNLTTISRRVLPLASVCGGTAGDDRATAAALACFRLWRDRREAREG